MSSLPTRCISASYFMCSFKISLLRQWKFFSGKLRGYLNNWKTGTFIWARSKHVSSCLLNSFFFLDTSSTDIQMVWNDQILDQNSRVSYLLKLIINYVTVFSENICSNTFSLRNNCWALLQTFSQHSNKTPWPLC